MWSNNRCQYVSFSWNFLAAKWPEVWNKDITKDTRSTRQSNKPPRRKATWYLRELLSIAASCRELAPKEIRQGICRFLSPERVIVGVLCDTGIIREHAANAERIARQLWQCWDDVEEDSDTIVNGLIVVAVLCCGTTSKQWAVGEWRACCGSKWSVRRQGAFWLTDLRFYADCRGMQQTHEARERPASVGRYCIMHL